MRSEGIGGKRIATALGISGTLASELRDPDLIRVWLAWLRGNGIEADRLSFRVHIHESADVDAAVRFWSDVVSFPSERFLRPTLKRHNPKTVRQNTGDDYRGCLVVGLYQGRLLYQRMAGVWRGVAGASGPTGATSGPETA